MAWSQSIDSSLSDLHRLDEILSEASECQFGRFALLKIYIYRPGEFDKNSNICFIHYSHFATTSTQ